MRTPLLLLILTLCFWLGPTGLHNAHSAPRTMPGVCGSVLPKNSRVISKNRYWVTYHRTIAGILKMYRKVYGKKNPSYKMVKLLSLQSVVAYHLKSYNKSTRWAGLNIVQYFKRRKNLQIFVICRKKN